MIAFNSILAAFVVAMLLFIGCPFLTGCAFICSGLVAAYSVASNYFSGVE